MNYNLAKAATGLRQRQADLKQLLVKAFRGRTELLDTGEVTKQRRHIADVYSDRPWCGTTLQHMGFRCDGRCPYCGARDAVYHRVIECPQFADERLVQHVSFCVLARVLGHSVPWWRPRFGQERFFETFFDETNDGKRVWASRSISMKRI